MKKILVIIVTFLVLTMNISAAKVNSSVPFNCAPLEYEVFNVSSSSEFTSKGCYTSFEQAKSITLTENSTLTSTPVVVRNYRILYTPYGIANFKLKSSSENTLLYSNTTTNSSSGYINGNYGVDGALLNYDDVSGRAYVKIADTYGWVNYADYEVVPLSQAKSINKYMNLDGEVAHYLANNIGTSSSYLSTLRLSKAPSYLAPSVNYYSYDGIYFYTNPITMLNDYRNKVYVNSINYSVPYYNYYLYLPLRSKSNYSGTDLDSYTTYRGYTASTSVMYDSGVYFVNSQSKYSVNSLSSFAVAINESAHGTSNIAKTKYNLFGHNAYDYSPTSSASGYTGVESSINAHANQYMSYGYLDFYDYRYFGGVLGSKSTGINVKYASDPYWSEKAASNMFKVDKYLGYKDYEYYSVGIKEQGSSVKVRSTPNNANDNNLMYTAASNYNASFVIVGEVTGDTVSGSNVWYKVVTDFIYDSNKKPLYIENSTTATALYDFNSSYGYIHSSLLKKTGSATYRNPASVVETGDATITTKNISNTVLKLDSNIVTYTNKELSSVSSTVLKNSNYVIATKEVLQNNVVIGYYVTYDFLSNSSIYIKNNGVTKRSTDIITSDATSINVRSCASINNTLCPKIGTIANKGTSFILYDTVIGDVYDSSSTWRKIMLNAEAGTYGYVHSSFMVGGPAANVIVDEKEEETEESNGIDYSQFVIPSGNYTTKDGVFDLYAMDYNKTNNTLNITGYMYINGVSSNSSRKYYLVVKDQNTKKEYAYKLDSLATGPFTIPNSGNINYKDSWFKGEVVLSNIPEGDYVMYVTTIIDNYKATNYMNNVFSKNIPRKITDSTGRGYAIKSNYFYKSLQMEMQVRNKGLISDKTPPTALDNMFNTYYAASFSGSKLTLAGNSYNIGGNYSKGTSLTRNIIFEDITSFNRYQFNAGYVDSGFPEISLSVSDGFSKDRAWFKNEIDIASLPNGVYTINVHTKTSNADDYGYLTNITYNFKNITTTYGNKKAYLRVNTDLSFRVELVIENN